MDRFLSDHEGSRFLLWRLRAGHRLAGHALHDHLPSAIDPRIVGYRPLRFPKIRRARGPHDGRIRRPARDSRAELRPDDRRNRRHSDGAAPLPQRMDQSSRSLVRRERAGDCGGAGHLGQSSRHRRRDARKPGAIGGNSDRRGSIRLRRRRRDLRPPLHRIRPGNTRPAPPARLERAKRPSCWMD